MALSKLRLCRLAFRAAQRRKKLQICRVLALLALPVMLARLARQALMDLLAQLGQQVLLGQREPKAQQALQVIPAQPGLLALQAPLALQVPQV